MCGFLVGGFFEAVATRFGAVTSIFGSGMEFPADDGVCDGAGVAAGAGAAAGAGVCE